MQTIEECKTRMQEIAVEMTEIASAQGEFPTSEQKLQMESLEKESQAMEDRIDMLLKADAAEKRLQATKKKEYPAQVTPNQPKDADTFKLPAMARKYSELKCFKDDNHAQGDVKAYRFGQFLKATLGSDRARNWCVQNGIEIRGGMLEDTNTKGGYLVPGEFTPDIIRLIESRGVFRREARVRPMTQDTLSIPRRTGGNTAYFIGEAAAITESNPTLDLVTLVARKMGAIVPVTSELSDDAVISVADFVAEEIAYSFADKEDECGFNGTGSGTYGGIVGVREQLIEKNMAGDETDTAAGGVVRYGTGYGFGNIGMDDLTLMIATLPMYAEASAKWYMSKTVWAYVLDLMADAGGNTIGTLQQGASGMSFLGYPVVLVNVMPKTAAINQINILLGDLSQAATFGDRRSMSMAISNSAYVGSTSMFETDQVAIRGIERFDINCHDVGDGTNAGPIVGLIAHTA